MFAQLPVSPGTLARRGDSLSVTVAGLILSLRSLNAIESPTIQALISGDFNLSGVTLNTSRVPDFTPDTGYYSATAAGYRRLIPLLEVEMHIQTGNIYPGPTLILPAEIIATACTQNPPATELFQIWCPMGVEPNSLFIIVATLSDACEAGFFVSLADVHPSLRSSQETESPSSHPALSQTSSWSNLSAPSIDSPRPPDSMYTPDHFTAGTIDALSTPSLAPPTPNSPYPDQFKTANLDPTYQPTSVPLQPAPVAVTKNSETRARSASARKFGATLVAQASKYCGADTTFSEAQYTGETTLTDMGALFVCPPMGILRPATPRIG
ncbi:hypothetical protein B0H11DRAFT_2236367 [Mycena galericulata]|nr:hypothetical protein B0H11DRAFT_2236367 [Mycena galericulata]